MHGFAHATRIPNQIGPLVHTLASLPSNDALARVIAERLRAFVVRYAGSAAPFNAEQSKALVVFFASLPIPYPRRPDGSTAPPVAKPVAAFAVRRAGMIRHVLRPGSMRTIIRDALVHRRERQIQTLIQIGGKIPGRPRSQHPVGPRKRYRLCLGRMHWTAQPADRAFSPHTNPAADNPRHAPATRIAWPASAAVGPGIV